MSYTKQVNGIAMSILGGHTLFYVFVADGQRIDPGNERARFERLKERLPEAKIEVTHDGAIVATDVAFNGYETFHSFR